MLTAINLDDQSCFHANEIGNIGRDRILAPNLESSEPPIAQQSPQAVFCVRLALP